MPRVLLIALLDTLIVSCAVGSRPGPPARSTDPQSVVNRTWQWQATVTPVERITVAHPERYTILLTSEGRLQARFDCNRGGGDYQLSEGRLSFGPLLSTRMACPPDSQDSEFMRDLQRVTSFFLENGSLYLELPLDSGTMHFRPAPLKGAQ
jgi:heat shock protein HslJ